VLLSPVRVADGRPLRCSSSTRVLALANIFCQWKACALVIASSRRACCRGIVTEFNTKKDGILLHDVLCFHFHDDVHKQVLTWHVMHLFHTGALQSHATASGDGGRTKIKGCLCQPAAVLPVQLGKKLISLLYCQTWYFNRYVGTYQLTYPRHYWQLSTSLTISSVNSPHISPQIYLLLFTANQEHFPKCT